MTADPDTPANLPDPVVDPDAEQFRDLAMVHGVSSSIRDAATRLRDEPTSPSATHDLRMLLGAPSDLARSALDRLQDQNRRRGLHVIDGGLSEDGESS